MSAKIKVSVKGCEKKTSRPTVRTYGLEVHYKKIAECFVKNINDGTWPEGSRVPSHTQLAATFSIGTRTIRRALACLAEEKRIVKNAYKQWIVNKSAQSFSFRSNPCIVLIANMVLETLGQSYEASRIRKGIEHMIGHCQFQIYFRDTFNWQMRNVVVPGLKEAALRGILLYGNFSRNCLQHYSALGIPVVRVDAPSSVARLASVSVDNFTAAKDAVIRIAHLGHRRIAFCRSVHASISEVDADSLERQAGFFAGLKECGLSKNKSEFFNFMSGAGTNSAPIAAILRARPRYTAVLCADDSLAKRIETAVLKTSLILPHDLSLVGFTALGSYSRISGPRIDFTRLGSESVKLLEAREVRTVRIPTSWHNGSTLVEAPPKIK